MNKQVSMWVLGGLGFFILFPNKQSFRNIAFDFLCLNLSVHFFFSPKYSLSIGIIRSKN